MNFSKTIFFLLTLLQLSIMNTCGKSDSVYSQRSSLGAAPEYSIAGRWKLTMSAAERIVQNSVKSSIPLVFNITSGLNISSTCKSSLLNTFRALYNRRPWAIKMLDASGKSFDGLFSGSVTALGNYDQCLSIRHPTFEFQGKYCLAHFSFPLPPRRLFFSPEGEIPGLKGIFEPGSIGADAVKLSPFLYTVQPRVGFCVPSTCSASEVDSFIRKGLKNMNLLLNLHVPHCEIQENVPYTTGEFLIITLFVILTAVVAAGTMIDIIHRSKSEEFAKSEKRLPVKCLLCFSAYTNFLKLLKKDDNPDILSIFHGLRVITLSWIILGHTYLPKNFQAYDGLLHAKDMVREFLLSPIVNVHISVDTFFFMSSVLVSYVCMRIPGKLNLIEIFFKRYWRLTPTMMLVVALVVLSGRFGSGPIWQETYVAELSDKCKKYGWWNLLYINNLFPMSDVCLVWSWYLSTDTHLFLIAMFAIVLLKRNPKKGFLAMLLLSMIGVIWTAIITLYYHLPPAYLHSFFVLEDDVFFTSKVHTPPQIHFPTAAIGIIVGYILALRKIRISKQINRIGWIFTGITMTSIIFGVYYWNQGHVPGVAVSALYSSTKRLLWGLCLAFITVSCTTKKKGFVYKFLSWEAFIPLSRLSYVAYLIHYAFIHFYTSNIRSTFTFTHKNMIFLFFGIWTMTFLFACPLSLIIESPFMALEKALANRETLKKILPVAHSNGREYKESCKERE